MHGRKLLPKGGWVLPRAPRRGLAEPGPPPIHTHTLIMRPPPISSGAFVHAARHKIALIVPDTSPRGAGIEGEDESYDLGTGAGFYVDASAAPWADNYRMYSYITSELPGIVEREFKISPSLRSISGHSMGGHGALTIAFKDPEAWASVSAFAPICNPSECAWGQKAFGSYLEGGVADGAAEYDAARLLQSRGPFPSLGEVLIDQVSQSVSRQVSR